jgi:2-polyprenyl-3-methyl-5-hydroxy-6-metoxy-1,4-benzoquinol methylase
MMLNVLTNIMLDVVSHLKWSDAKECIQQNRGLIERDAVEFLHGAGLIKDGQTIDTLLGRWASYIEGHFDKTAPDAFYRSWTGEIGAANIAENIKDQFSRPYILSCLLKLPGGTAQVLDYGCGTAAISMLWQRCAAPKATLYLADVDNLSREFTTYEQKQHGNVEIKLVSLALDEIPPASLDAVLCIHVLEHVANPMAILRRLDTKIKRDGVVLIEAPWGGHPEHLQEAIVDWNTNKGNNFLKKYYQRIGTLNPKIRLSGGLSGMYRKK